MFEVTERDGIAVVKMMHGKANTFDMEFCEAIAARFDALRSAPPRAVVLTGQGRIFSAGVNLVRLIEGGPDYVRKFLPVLERGFRAVFGFPKPLVAAINGHAVAGGCVLACAADRRIMAREGGRIGVTELQVGVPFPPLSFEIMRFAAAPHLLEDVILGASTHAPEEALARGLVHEVVAGDALLDRAFAAAQWLAGISPAAYATSKRQTRQAAFDAVARDGDRWDKDVTDIWVAPATLERIRDYVARTLKKA